MPSVLRPLLALGVAALLGGSALAERQALVIVHTNDIHANFEAEPAAWRDDRALMGGFVALEAFVRAQRERFERVLVLDGGDILTGTPLSRLEVKGVVGGAVVRLMNAVGYDAGVIGNHEFDNGADQIPGLVRLAEHDVICANLLRPDGTLYADAPGAVYELDGLRVAVVGLITDELRELLHGDALRAFELLPAVESARAWFDGLDAKPDLKIALTHRGIDADRALAAAMPELDLIVGGHSHTALAEPERVGDTWIVQAGSRLRAAGWVHLEVEDGAIVSLDGRLEPLYARDLRAKRSLARRVAAGSERIDAAYGMTIGAVATPLTGASHRDSNLGSWICDRMAELDGADFAWLNSRGIRKELPAGPVTRLDVIEMLPFQNYLVRFELAGAELLDILRHNARVAHERERAVLQLGRIESRYRVEDGELRLVDPRVGGEPIDPAKRYRGVSVDYVMLSQPERYCGVVFDPARIELRPELLADLIERAFQESGTVDFVADGRLSPVDAD